MVEAGDPQRPDAARPLTERQREILRFLLPPDLPQRDVFLKQAAAARVSARCPCGCATIHLSIDPTAAPRAEVALPYNAVDATTGACHELDRSFELLLFIEDGWLSYVEIVYYGDEPPAEFPPPAAFEPPQVKRA